MLKDLKIKTLLNIWKKYIPNAMYCNLYGPTEATVASTYFIVNREIDDSENGHSYGFIETSVGVI